MALELPLSSETAAWLSFASLEGIIANLEESKAADRVLTTEEMVRFFSILSHDLKSPIFAVDGFSELLLEDYQAKLDDEGKDFLKRVRSSSQYMKRVLDDMSHIVKVLSRPTTTHPTPLREVFEEVLLKYNFLVEEGGVKVEIPVDLPTLNLDPEKMRDAIGAIISNALIFTDRPKGERKVTVESSSAGEMHRICVRDNGIGIDPKYANQVFELGGMSKLEKSRGGGPGYGLYLAKRVIEAHGGALTVESVPAEGSSFCFTIPVQKV